MKLLVFLFTLVTGVVCAQDKNLPYAEIPPDPKSFSAGTVAARMIDGLGFRYHWATEGLRSQDLAFKPSAEARTAEETVTHIYEMSILILHATTKTANVPGQNKKLPFAEMRSVTLRNFWTAAENLRTCTEQQMKEYNFIFMSNTQTITYPFWNMINGPIEDCVWHVGQLVSFRRSSGNPFNSKAEVFTGRLEK
ncbi:MAG TPA: hypothetical protein DGG95_16515 [Cytophagales bacterium]|jgi:hypothetical protein|nr:hypothetical protein [Cytophagales bacterium]